MKLRVSGKNFDIGDVLRTQVETRLNALIDKYLDGKCTVAQATFSKEGNGFGSDCYFQLPEGATLEATGKSHDAYAAFDQAISHMETRLQRHRGRLKGRHSGRANTGTKSPMVVYESPTVETMPEEFHPVIIAESTTTLEHFSVPEAVAELDLTGASALVFIHSGTKRVNVLHRRQDGAIGWIDSPTH